MPRFPHSPLFASCCALPLAGTARAGIVRLMQRQQQGWTYIRP